MLCPLYLQKKCVVSACGVHSQIDRNLCCRYDVSYTRDYAVNGRKVQALVKVINPLSQPVTVQTVTYTISRPAGQVPLTGTAICNETFAGAAEAAMQQAAKAAFADVAPSPTGQGADVAARPSNGVVSFTLPAAPAIINTPQPVAAPSPTPAASRAYPRLKLFNFDISLTRGGNTKAEAAANSDADVPQDKVSMFFGSDALVQSGPEPYYCSFVMNIPDDFASDVSVTVVTDRLEEAKAVAPYKLDWSLATSYESGR